MSAGGRDRNVARRIAVVLGLLIQTPAAGQLAPGVPLAQVGRAQGLTPEIEAVLKDMLAAYRGLEAYADAGRIAILQETGRIQQATKMPSSVVFARPSRIAVVGGMQTVACDGEQLQIVLDALKQYQQAPAPEVLTMERVRMGAPGAGLDQGYPEVLEFLIGERVYERWVALIDSIALRGGGEPREIAGRRCIELAYRTIHRADITLYIDAETSLLMRADIENTEAQRPAGGARDPLVQLPRTQIVLQLDPVRTGAAALAGRSFTLRDGAAEGMRRVEEFDPSLADGTAPPDGAGAGVDLIGKPAPAITATDIEGATVTPEQFSGRPALYFLWSPKGDPGSLGAIGMIGRIRDQLGEAGGRLAVLGISTASDPPGLARDVLAAKGATFRNVVDHHGNLTRGFGAIGVPAYVVAAADGRVLEVLRGPPEEVEARLTTILNRAVGRPPSGAANPDPTSP